MATWGFELDENGKVRSMKNGGHIRPNGMFANPPPGPPPTLDLAGNPLKPRHPLHSSHP